MREAEVPKRKSPIRERDGRKPDEVVAGFCYRVLFETEMGGNDDARSFRK